MSNQKSNDSSLVISYKMIITIVGYLGIFLPIILYFGALLIFGTGLRPSISAYYHTGMGDVLVGTLFAIGVFLFTYRGWDNDYIYGRWGCKFAIGICTKFVMPSAKEWLGGSLVFYMETLAIWAFGIAWSTKGEALKYLRD